MAQDSGDIHDIARYCHSLYVSDPFLIAPSSWKTGTYKIHFWIHHGIQPGPGTEQALLKYLLTDGLMEEKKEGEEKEEGREGRRNPNTRSSRQGESRKVH